MSKEKLITIAIAAGVVAAMIKFGWVAEGKSTPAMLKPSA